MEIDIVEQQKTKLIAFDLGYTLVYNSRETYYIKYLEKQNIKIDKEKVEHAFHQSDKIFMRYYIGALGQSPESFLPWYLGLINYTLGLELNLNEQSNYFMEQTSTITFWQLYPWTIEVLEKLKEAGYEIALLSNWDEGCRELLQDLSIKDLFSFLLISAEVQVEKPDKQIFEILMETSGYNAEEIIYVGDNYYDDVNGSRKVGIETILINRFGKFGIEEINDCKVISSTKDLLPLFIKQKNILKT